MQAGLILFFAGGIILWGIARGIEAIIKRVRQLNMHSVLWLDGDSPTYHLERRAITGNTLERTTRGRAPRTYKLSGTGHSGNLGRLYILHPRHGWNLRAPLDKDTVEKDRLLQFLAPNNPEAYFHAIKVNESQDSLQANQQGEPWWAKVAPMALIAVILTLVVVAFIAWRLINAGL